MTSKTYSLDSVKAVILVGNPDFGRCRLATRLNRALWPFAGRPVLQRLIEHISNQGIRRFVICCSKWVREIQNALDIPDHLSVEFCFDQLPRGTAGSIRDAVNPEQDELIFVFPAAVLTPPDLHELILNHREKMASMTIFFNPSENTTDRVTQDAQIYVCEPQIIKYIPVQGYFDMKENLVPTLIQDRKTIAFGQLQHHAGNYRHWNEYIRAVQQCLISLDPRDPLLQSFQKFDSDDNIWVGKNVKIDPSARIVGPALIGDNTIIGSDTLVFGPILIESDVCVHSEVIISESVIWKQAVIGPHCRVQNSLINEKKILSAHKDVNKRMIVDSSGWISRVFSSIKSLELTGGQFGSVYTRPETTFSKYFSKAGGKTAVLLVFLAVFGCLLAAYWNPTLIELWRVWIQSDEYSSGLLVPLLAGYIIWDRKKELMECQIKPVPWAVFILFLAQILRLLGLLIWSPSLERFSLFLTIGVLIWMVFGVWFMKKMFPIWLYLIFMFPLPKMFEWKITIPLQKWASASAVFCLETLGFSVFREGNIINVNGTQVAVAEACNGLRMLTAFFVVTGFVVLLTRRRLWEKILILLSSVPIALLCNTIRLTLTSIAFLYVEANVWEKVFHDYGGLAMMPLALGITLFELWFLSKLVIEPDKQAVQPQIIIRKK